eukprot:2895931-Prymnesium_polylepis.1
MPKPPPPPLPSPPPPLRPPTPPPSCTISAVAFRPPTASECPTRRIINQPTAPKECSYWTALGDVCYSDACSQFGGPYTACCKRTFVGDCDTLHPGSYLVRGDRFPPMPPQQPPPPSLPPSPPPPPP